MARRTSITDLEMRLLGFFLDNIGEHFAIREVARKTAIDYKLAHTAIQRLAERGAIIKKRKANVDLCSLDIKQRTPILYYLEMLRAQEFLRRHAYLSAFFASVQSKARTAYYSLVVFGSFAKKTETKSSDLDLLIIAPVRKVAEEIERLTNSEALFLKRKVQAIALDESEFIENLRSREPNVPKEAYKNHTIITGVEGFYNAVRQVS